MENKDIIKDLENLINSYTYMKYNGEILVSAPNKKDLYSTGGAYLELKNHLEKFIREHKKENI